MFSIRAPSSRVLVWCQHSSMHPEVLRARCCGDFTEAAQSEHGTGGGIALSPSMACPCRPALAAPHIPTGMFARVQAFLRICKNSLCLTCTKPQCNALLKQDSKIRTTAKHYLKPKTHFAIWTQAQRKHCSSTSLLFLKNQEIFGNDALFPLFK